jgi:hypothetical protein
MRAACGRQSARDSQRDAYRAVVDALSTHEAYNSEASVTLADYVDSGYLLQGPVSYRALYTMAALRRV